MDPFSQGASGPVGAAGARAHAESLAVLASTPVRVGTVRHYFPRLGVARVELDAPLAAGERIYVRGATSDLVAQIRELRVSGEPAARAEGGEATLAVPERVRPGDAVFALRMGA
jgi:hypothetical protein